MEPLGSKALEEPGFSPEVFDLDVTNKTVEKRLCNCQDNFGGSSLSESSPDGDDDPQIAPVGEHIGTPDASDVSSVVRVPDRQPSGIELCRKVLPDLHEEGPCCSICLDEYTDEDPSMATTCGHGYHLQCIMQWAQRSRECPLCFHTLQLEVR
jgi:hypothetical protein